MIELKQMKLYERVNYILLGTLWTLFIVLILDFWLNTVYNFNMFSNTHWQFVANMQAANQPIKTGFYIAITIAIVMCIAGLYVLFRPRFRKIILTPPQKISEPKQSEPDTNKTEKNISIEQPVVIQKQLIQRPPRLHIQQHNITPTQATQTHFTGTIQAQPVTKQKPRYTHEMREIFEKNGYKVLNTKNIAGTALSLISVGTGETLWLGACDISHEQMADTILAFKKIFKETLDDIEIDINAFILNPSDNDKVDAILDIKSIEDLSNIIADYKNPEETEVEEEAGSFDAFTSYIETVLAYLGNK